MSEIDEILRDALNAGASDVHITVGIPPKMRVNGELVTMDKYPRIMPKDTEEIRDQIMNEEQRKAFEERGEYDMSFSIRTYRDFVLIHINREGL
jgi:twitching motility protein PilT